MTVDKDNIFYCIALTLVPGIGPVNAKSLISYCGSPENVFKTSRSKLLKIPGVGGNTADAIINHNVFQRVEEEIKFIEKNEISCFTYFDDKYPQRLKNCIDAPVILFYKGNADLNMEKVLGIVGTRKATEYGKNICEELLEELKEYNFLMISGLAYGIDIAAHKACVKKNIPNVGVLGHGLDMIYPYQNKEVAKKMIDNGGLLSEFISNTQPDKQNFPKRNRIVAGIIDALILVETAVDGGAMITAAVANSYNRDVMAFPGDVKNKYSRGCNKLIKTNRAALVENADDVVEFLNWNQKEKKPKPQRELFLELSVEEKLIYNLLNERNEISIDEITSNLPLTPSALASNLLNLEFQGIIASLPGKRYKLL